MNHLYIELFYILVYSIVLSMIVNLIALIISDIHIIKTTQNDNMAISMESTFRTRKSFPGRLEEYKKLGNYINHHYWLGINKMNHLLCLPLSENIVCRLSIHNLLLILNIILIHYYMTFDISDIAANMKQNRLVVLLW